MAESDLIRGNVDTVILKVLYEGDRYGYDLIRQINARSDGQWEIKQPTVYACLKRLEKQGFVSSYWDSSESDGGRRKYYTLTESGKEVFLRYKSEFERATALFGGLITDAEPVFKQDDYSDIEDESYTVSKRPRPKRKKQSDEKTESKTDTEGNADSFDMLERFDGNAQNVEADKPLDNADVSDTTGKKTTNEGVVILDEAETDKSVAEQDDADYVNDLISLAESLADSNVELAAMEKAQAAEAERREQDPPSSPIPTAREALDPHAIIDSYYNNERGESYSDMHGKLQYAPPQKADELPATVKSTAPVSAPPPATAPTPVATKQPAPTAPKVSAIGFPEEESQARREYKNVLTELVERLEVSEPVVREQPRQAVKDNEEIAAVTSEADRQFIKVKTTARDLGDDVQVIAHNNSAKQYAHKYYYYSNRLMLTHYTIMSIAMFLIGLTLFLTFYTGLKLRMPYDYLLYIGAGLLPIAMFVTAVAKYWSEPDKRKRININFTSSIFIRCIIMLQVAVIVYCVNLIWGMPVGFSYGFLPSLLIPLAYSLFIPLSKVIFMILLQSGNYAVE